MRITNITRIMAAVLTGAGLVILGAVVSALTLPESAGGLLYRIGTALYLRFQFAVFYLPLYLFACSVLLILKKFRILHVLILIFTLLPFITLSLFFQLISLAAASPAKTLFAGLFGIQGGAFVLLTLLLVELLILMRLVFRNEEAVERSNDLQVSESVIKSEPGIQAGNIKSNSFSSPGTGIELEDDARVKGPSDDFTSYLKEGLSPVLNSRSDMGSSELPRAEVRDTRDSSASGVEVFSPPVFIDKGNKEDMNFISSETDPFVREIMTAEAVVKTVEADEETAWVDYEAGIDDEDEPAEEVEEYNEEAEAIETIDGIIEAIDEVIEYEAPDETVELAGDIDSDESLELEELDTVAAPDETEPAETCENSLGEPEGAVLPPRTSASKRRKIKYDVPDQLLSEYADGQYWIIDEGTRTAGEVLRRTLEEFNIAAEVTGISKGPVITMFELLPAPGVKLSKIVNLADNIALRLAASRVRIVAPIPGKHAVGIEVPNENRAIVSFKEMLDSESRETRKMQVPVILGKDITGGARIIDLVQTPHLLIAGATGSGKSVCVNSLICSLLYKRKPEEVKLILIDPKIVELKLYNGIPHLLTPVITDPKRAFKALQYAIFEMERRYSLLDALGVREIRSYNARIKEQKLATDSLPYIVIVVDEFADLMATSGKELEATIARLTAMSRAVGIHLVLATQRPSVDVITGLIKANIPSRIAFMVASKFDSRIIIDGVGAEKLLGKGDMLFTSAWDPNPIRIQGAYLSEEEAERVADHVKTLGEPDYIDDEIFLGDDDEDDFQLSPDSGNDPLFETAISIVVEAGKASASYLQRRLKIGYNRAARLVEEMEVRGIVGPSNGSKPREILHIPDRK